MNGENGGQLAKRGIVITLNPDGTREAMEVVVHPPVGDEAKVSAIPETARALPLTRAEAQEWVNAVMKDSDEESRQHWISLLCNVEATEST